MTRHFPRHISSHLSAALLPLCATLLFLFGALASAVAQEQEQEEQPREITVLAARPSVAPFDAASAAEEAGESGGVADSSEFDRLLRDLLAAELSAERIRVVDDRAVAADAHETVVSVVVRYRQQEANLITVVLTLVDEATGDALGGGVYTGFADLGLVRVVRDAVSDARAQLEQIVDLSPGLVAVPETLIELSMRSPHPRGALRFQENRPPLTRSTVPFEIGSRIALLHSAPGYYPRTEYLRIDAPIMRYEAPELEPVIEREFVYSWTTARPLGAGAGLRVYPLPRLLFLELGAHGSSGYRFTRGSRFTASFDLRLNLGGYVYRSRQRRFAASVAPGAGVILTTLPAAEGSATFADSYLVLGSLAAEIPLPRLAPFARLDFLYYARSRSGFFAPGVFPYLSFGVRQAWID